MRQKKTKEKMEKTKQWTINIKEQTWTFDNHFDAKQKIKLLVDAGLWYLKTDDIKEEIEKKVKKKNGKRI